MIKNKKRRNKIHGLIINGVWETEVKPIQKEVWRFFKSKFEEPFVSRPKFVNPKFIRLSLEDCIELEKPFSPEEIKAAIYGCGSEKAPGPADLLSSF